MHIVNHFHRISEEWRDGAPAQLMDLPAGPRRQTGKGLRRLLKLTMTFYTGSFPSYTTLAPGKRSRGGFMHRRSTVRRSTVFFSLLAISLATALTGCVGKSSSNSGGGGVQTVTLSPSPNSSIDIGAIQVFSATAKNAKGQTIIAASIQYVVTSGNSNPAPISITSNGAACAGSWNASASICSPGVPGVALVTAVIDGVSSAPTTVYVHQHIDSIQVAPVTPPQNDCFSQHQTWDYQAIAYDINRLDITNTVGPFSWSASNQAVLTIDNIKGLLPNQTQVTAKTPGITQLFASVSGTTSSPLQKPFTTCLVSYIRLQIEGETGNSFTINNGGSKTIKATVVDTLGVTLASPPLTWTTTNPEVASFSNAATTTGTNSVTARNNQGGAAISAACTPPTCNVGVLPGLPVYASDGLLPPPNNDQQGYGVISVDITSTKPPTYTAWTATTDCGTNFNCSSVMFAVTPGATPIGVSLILPRTPNSMTFTQQGARVYLGSDQGLMYVDVTASTPSATLVSTSPTPCNVSLCGKVLAISPDGNRVVVSDATTIPHQVYIFNAASTSTAPIDLVLPSGAATAAAFSRDEMKIFILTDVGTMYVYSTVDALAPLSIATSATSAAFSANGSFAYVAGTPAAASISGFATCNTANVLTSTPKTSVAPVALFPLPSLQLDSAGKSTQVVLALDPPNIYSFGVNVAQADLNHGQFVCDPPSVTFDDQHFPQNSFNLGQGSFAPLYAQLVGNGNEVVLVAKKIPAVLFFSVTNGTTTAIPLVNNGDPLSASASTNGSQVYVAACDAYTNNDPTQPCASGSVHIINTLSGGDIQQVPYINNNTNNSMCIGLSPCNPNLVAIKPQ